MDPVAELSREVEQTAAELAGNGKLSRPKLDCPKQVGFGDYSSNAAMLLAPTLGQPPRDIATRLGDALGERLGHSVDRVEIAGPGFLNLFMADGWYLEVLAAILAADEGFGRGDQGERIQVEFVSADPHRPRDRGLRPARRLRRFALASPGLASNQVEASTRERRRQSGAQVRRGGSGPELAVRSPRSTARIYVRELPERDPGAADADPDELARRGIELLLEGVERTPARFRVHMDRYFHKARSSESVPDQRGAGGDRSVRVGGRAEAAYHGRRRRQGPRDASLERRSSTGFATDIGHYADKLALGYDHWINVLGSDHHGYVKRIYAAWRSCSLAAPPEAFEVVIMQFVNLLEGGEPVRCVSAPGRCHASTTWWTTSEWTPRAGS